MNSTLISILLITPAFAMSKTRSNHTAPAADHHFFAGVQLISEAQLFRSAGGGSVGRSPFSLRQAAALDHQLNRSNLSMPVAADEQQRTLPQQQRTLFLQVKQK